MRLGIKPTAIHGGIFQLHLEYCPEHSLRLSLFETLTWERLSQHLTQPSTKAVPATTRPDKGRALLRKRERDATRSGLRTLAGSLIRRCHACTHALRSTIECLNTALKKVFQSSIQALGLPQQGGRHLSFQSASDSPHPVACPLHVSYLALRQPPTVAAIYPQYMAFQTIGKMLKYLPPQKRTIPPRVGP